MSARLPIFPLPLVLFPGTPQALHIFEPRYRQMLADCEAGDRLFGISYIANTSTADPAPKPGDVGCAAKIHIIRQLPDGRANIMTVGIDRYVLRAYLDTDRLYRVGAVEYFDDTPGEDNDVDALAADVRREFAQFTEAVASLKDTLVPPLDLPDDPKQISFHVAAALDIELETKQALLESRSTAERLQQLREILLRLHVEIAGRLTAHTRAKGNGKSG